MNDSTGTHLTGYNTSNYKYADGPAQPGNKKGPAALAAGPDKFCGVGRYFLGSFTANSAGPPLR